MKLQTILCAAALAALPVVANVTGSNVCGWMKIESSLKNTIVAVPWVEVGEGTDIKVANLVKTDNLTAGDFLYVYTGTWNAYKLEGTPLVWKPAIGVGEKGVEIPAAPDDQKIACGSAIFLQRQDASKPFYIYGQYVQNVDEQKEVTAGVSAPAFSLVASPKDTAFDPNGTGAITDANVADKIIIPQNGGASLIYSWNADKSEWGCYEKKTVEFDGQTFSKQTWKAADVIPMGTGFWYVSQGESAAKLKW